MNLLVLIAIARGATLELLPPSPVQGQPVTVQVVDEEASPSLRVVYRPNSAVEREETLSFDATGEATWVPAEPGIAVLIAEGDDGPVATHHVSVRFAAVPWAGLAVFLCTSTLLFGTAAFATRRLFVPMGPPS